MPMKDKVSSTSYLYGASIQGIQSFIFQTDRLKDIVGASELVEQACTDMFYNEFFDEKSCKLIVSAAGNVKCIFSDEDMCSRAVLSYPKRVMEKAPGVTISQAVVKMTGVISPVPLMNSSDGFTHSAIAG